MDNKAKDYVYLSNASSRQKECIRISQEQDIFMNILDGSKVLIIIEKLEADLFPIAQK
ncbi:hypothetical protein [Trichormus azollae]|uniref:hypothetical protein n=1 Tax=Trichormus azollae TaxID=1164 RepID=UPI00325D2703